MSEVWQSLFFLAFAFAVIFALVSANAVQRKFDRGDFQPFLQAMRHNLKYAIIGLAIIIAVSIHACSTRYYSVGNRMILDRWTGRVFDGKK